MLPPPAPSLTQQTEAPYVTLFSFVIDKLVILRFDNSVAGTVQVAEKACNLAIEQPIEKQQIRTLNPRMPQDLSQPFPS